MQEQLFAKIQDRSAIVGVIGLGYVGLPLAMEFAKAGFRVIGYDVSQRVIDTLMSGQSHIQDVDSADVAAALAGRHVRGHHGRSRGCTSAMPSPSPCPRRSPRRATRTWRTCWRRPTPCSGTPTRGCWWCSRAPRIPAPRASCCSRAWKRPACTVGEDVFLAFSPERVDPGNPVYQTHNTPKVVGGITPACVRTASALYQSCIETIVPVSPRRKRPSS
jgi:UDP-N-acetyl-D-glucosamine dehydrogenase